MRQNRLLIFGFALIFIIFGCDSGGSDDTSPETGAAILTLNNLNPIPGDYHLEAWVVTSDLATLSLGKFTVGSGGKLFNLAGEELATRRLD
ncbi:MAG: anti-sigma factor, partial [Rhodothermaceae bacterium]|nr:anti-sigma factor [Rhodothermaceae bacterium]